MIEDYRLKKYCLDINSVYRQNRVELLLESKKFFEKLFEVINGAKESLIIEIYEFADDAVGKKVADILKKKASMGVRVRIIYDSIGSWFSDRNFFSDLKKSGVEIAEYNPASKFYNFKKFFRRDHRKIVAADCFSACIGGFNISLDYAPPSMGGREWKDSGLYVEGKAVLGLFEIFEETWSKIKNIKPQMPCNLKESNFDSVVSILKGSGLRNYFSIRRNYKYAIDAAVEEIFITNAYFLPDKIIYRRLIHAARRGVDVRIITPGKTDHPYVRIASWALFPGLVKNGVRVYEWRGKILHAKTAVIDGFWVSVGSHNLDHRSLHYNLELNANVYDEKIGKQMRDAFLKDLENCEPITIEKCKQRSLGLKLLSYFLYLFRSWL